MTGSPVDCRGDDPFRDVFAGPLESLPRPRRGDTSCEGPRVTFPELGDPAVMAMIQERFATVYPGGDRRAVASMWSKWLFNAVLPSLVGLLLADGRACAADDSSLGVVLDEAGYPERFWIRDQGDITAPVSMASGFEALLRDRLAPVIEALASVSGASRNVFWSNAGNSVEYLVGEMARHPAITPATLQQAYAFFETRRFADGQRNPLFRPVRYHSPDGDGAVERRRRVCCIRYLLPGTSYCANCPLACRDQAGAAADKAVVRRDRRRAPHQGVA
ncbi:MULTISPECIES: siderophore-iron reductase FhuF [unclassified Guyparkeria]|uniref:siderophore-iron reductase FhuF n=1 Tax=unclassified Guyparkeria TaxID=2626246 RepID=UPI0018D24D7D|nr:MULTISPECIES: siderophore-iron reductase FhuF [unclassified Guyparkeria]